MAIPEVIWINGREYWIEDCGSSPTGDLLLGCAKYCEGIVLLNQDLDLEGQLKTLLHEVAHICQQDSEGHMDERIANLFSLWMHNLFCHNRALADCYCTHGQHEDENGDTG